MTDGNLHAIDEHLEKFDHEPCPHCDDENCTCAEDAANERGDWMMHKKKDE